MADKSTSDHQDQEQPKQYVVEFPSGEPPKETPPKDAKQSAAPDSDSIRSNLGKAAPILASLLSKGKEPDKEEKSGQTQEPPKEAAKSEKPKEEGSTETPAEGAPTDDDRRAERLLGVKPKKGKKEKAESQEVAPPPQAQPQQPVMPPEQVAELAAKAASEVLKGRRRAEKPVEYPEEFRESAAIFDKMAQTDPKRYGDLKQKLNQFAANEREYRALWESENPGQQFDPEDDQHSKFYSENAPDIDEQDMNAAEEAIEEERIQRLVSERVQKEVGKAVEPIVVERAQAQLQPVVAEANQRIAISAIRAVLPKVDPTKLTPEQVAELEEKYPKQLEVANAAMTQKAIVAQEYIRVTNRLVPLDMKNPVHAEVVDVVQRVQAFIQSRPRDERTRVDDRGVSREFMPIERYVNLPAADRDRYWTIGQNEVLAQLEEDAESFAAKQWKRERAILEKYGAKIDDGPDPAPASVRQSAPDKTRQQTTQTPKHQKVEVSSASAERGGIGTPDGVVKIPENGMFARFMAGLRPARASQ